MRLMGKREPGCECTCGRAGCASNRRDKYGRVIQHGTQNAYNYHECRCADCIAAHYAKADEARARVNEATRELADRHRQEWTSADLEIATRTDLTAREAALKLGRTMHAVLNMRRKCRKDPGLLERIEDQGR